MNTDSGIINGLRLPLVPSSSS